MRVALYIDDGLEQVVLTPETDAENTILNMLHDGTRKLLIKRGDFYACRGGWVREGTAPTVPTQRSSTMLVLKRAALDDVEAGP